MNNNESLVCEDNCYNYFKNLPPNIGINGGKKYFKCLDLEVFQLIWLIILLKIKWKIILIKNIICS